MIRYFCDKCGKEMKPEEIFLVRIDEFSANVCINRFNEIQVCEECKEQIMGPSVEIHPVKQVNRLDKQEEITNFMTQSHYLLEDCDNIDNDFETENYKEKLLEDGLNIVQNIFNIFDKYELTKQVPEAVTKHKERMKKENWTFKEWK